MYHLLSVGIIEFGLAPVDVDTPLRESPLAVVQGKAVRIPSARGHMDARAIRQVGHDEIGHTGGRLPVVGNVDEDIADQMLRAEISVMRGGILAQPSQFLCRAMCPIRGNVPGCVLEEGGDGLQVAFVEPVE
jgi:hypothetical protein